MKQKFALIVLISLFCFSGGITQQDPLAKSKRSKEDKAKDEQKLNAKGKAEYAKAQADFKKIKDATFELAPNEIVNEDLENLTGVPNATPDNNLAEEQIKEGKKNQQEIQTKLKKDSKNDKVEMNFDTEASPPVGASWTDAAFFFVGSPVKNQGGCGSCWAFAAASAFENTYRKFYGSIIDISEQDILACGRNCGGGDCGSCSGGWSDHALDFIKCKGVASEASYPYNPSQGNSCYNKPKFKTAYGWWPINYTYQKEWIKYYLTTYGAVVTYMKAGISTFLSYGGGAYNGWPNSNGGGIDHAVTIVGWYEPWQCWIIQNSWGDKWGPYGGYAYVRYDNCNIGKYVYLVYPNK
jgi:C1A family cysteine protease